MRWRAIAPWADDDDVEQDLVITLALFDIFRDEILKTALAFRGGTALHKLHLAPAARYSEDIDLVQREPGPIGPTLSRLRHVLDWIGPARSETGEHPKLTFRFETENGTRRRVKLEINSHEHFGHVAPRLLAVPDLPVANSAAVPTYDLDELLATKLRALYQRRKGRDLFDLWWAHDQADPDPTRIVALLGEYQAAAGRPMIRASELHANLAAKRTTAFLEEVRPLLRPRVSFAIYRWVSGRWKLAAWRDVRANSLGQVKLTWTFSSRGERYVRSVARSRFSDEPGTDIMLLYASHYTPRARYSVR